MRSKREKELMAIINGNCLRAKVKSCNIKKSGFDMILEVSTKKEQELLEKLGKINGLLGISLLTHEGEVRF